MFKCIVYQYFLLMRSLEKYHSSLNSVLQKQLCFDEIISDKKQRERDFTGNVCPLGSDWIVNKNAGSLDCGMK